jgi:probable FeS assembly SUF system protein SufT
MRSTRRESIEASRAVRAQQVPSGREVLIEAGSTGFLTQQLGGSFTLYIDGSLFRIDGADGDAIGKAAALPTQFPQNPLDDEVRGLVWAELREVYDPEIPCSIVDLGLVYVCDVLKMPGPDFNVSIKMTVTAPGCGMGEQLVQEVAQRLERIPRVSDFSVEMVYDPPWNRSMMSEVARLQLGMF